MKVTTNGITFELDNETNSVFAKEVTDAEKLTRIFGHIKIVDNKPVPKDHGNMIVAEYEVIKQKKSKLSRLKRDKIVTSFEFNFKPVGND